MNTPLQSAYSAEQDPSGNRWRDSPRLSRHQRQHAPNALWTIRLSIAPKNYGNFRPAGCASLKQDDVTVHSQATPNPATRVARRVAIEPIREGACAGDHRVQRSY